jgi:outer membrane lipoprotein-sorting protein
MMVCFYPRAFAFVLQGEHILELMAAKLGQAESLYITQKVIFYNISPQPVSAGPDQADPDQADLDQVDLNQENTSPGEDVAVPESASDPEDYPTAVENQPVATIVEMEASIRYLFPQAFRSDIITDDNQRIHVYANGQALTIIDGATRAIPQTRFDFYKDLLLIRSRPELVERLTRLNVDMSISSLGRFEGRIYFVIGAQYPDESRTQIWVDQENFRPLRWIIAPGAVGFQSDKLEIRYLDWWQFNDSFWYPMRIEYYQDDILVREIKVQRYEVDASIPAELFDIEQLRSAYPPAESVSSDAGESRPVSDVQEAIEEFGKMFE